MSPEQRLFLSLHFYPSRPHTEHAPWYLGFQPHELPILLGQKLIKACGHPPVSGVKYFATVYLERLKTDERWMDRASGAIIKYWRGKNSRRKKKGSATQADNGPAVAA
jgi:hypothetical protein